MQLQAIMVKDVITIQTEEGTAKAAQRMREKSVGCLVVTSAGKIKGIVTDRDLLGCLSEGHDTHRCKVSTHMTSPVVTAHPHEELLRAAELMVQKRIKRLPVVERDHLVGIVSFSDISRMMHEQAQDFWDDWVLMTRLIRAQALHHRRN